MALLPLDGPSLQDVLTVTTGTVVEVKVGATVLPERKVVTLQPIDDDLRVFFGDGVSTPSAATVGTKGLLLYKGAKDTYEASERQPLFILAVIATTSVITVERA